ncbi:MAG TPA: tRNA preQ1(34) S-adenosylmethionine ribosyltransferase-isomerase QueA [Bacteroidales bacterium]|jgi:S-adenosylmethionine:tRNA ribosyltransferase-isomerase|nr:tRNA preQ1(34) S-adenosylmethionine ribosyltransferase-isomerase QueA [Bacteroidales bacterium]MCZ2416255.1 tRNA preQ1(34) S-adenosylmethionine ribosyltransferase-isomerase QueA [Burkholderiales bacterium]OQC58529.1 MAG: S-adenosylmethionine:tRNA ribosyltransferase-isomerase [Bacteroidetes bacterium ADurb.Bin013]MBP8999563.1 tRNA preQ1(34) S-adenosylmethionine ribosyltransferase-isomerase QueA [Bacteroidales bacterium]MBV6455210.1 S-adenosylmethionine:tRNA ribosyltransferase-isomerase [Bacte
MKLSQFNFDLPHSLIASRPATNRDESRMMVLNKKTGALDHMVFKDIITLMQEHDVVIFNNTKVFPARLHGNKEKTGAEIEVFLLRELNKDQRLWDVLVDPARKIRIGNKLYFGENDALVAEVIDNTTSRGRTLRFLCDGTYDNFKTTLLRLGEMPIPKWIRKHTEPFDQERYQSVFAKVEGAVAAPDGALHFSKELLKRMAIKGVISTEITLHMGMGHFRTVDVEDLSKHKMDSEPVVISPSTAQIINHAKASGNRVFATGIDVLRAVETHVTTKREVTAFEGWTNKFIFPPYDFYIPNALITNFHLPQSTMLMFVAAFGGYDTVMKAYKTAVKEKYHFGAYGDAMLII